MTLSTLASLAMLLYIYQVEEAYKDKTKANKGNNQCTGHSIEDHFVEDTWGKILLFRASENSTGSRT